MYATIDKREGLDLELEFTEVYQKYQYAHKAIREAQCVAFQMPRIITDIEDDDLVPGGCHYGAVGFSSQIGGFIYYLHEDKVLAELAAHNFSDSYKAQVEDMLQFWKDHDTKTQLRNRYTPRQLIAMPTDEWEIEQGITYPLYRMAGAILDFDTLLTLGIPGLETKIQSKLQNSESFESSQLYEAMIISINTLKQVITIYANRAKEKAHTTHNPDVKRRMEQLEQALRDILTTRPTTLLEAVELYWMYTLVSEVRNYGRIDVYLGDFYAEDVDSGRLTKYEANQIIIKLWERMAKRRTITDGRIFVGGRGRRNPEQADRVAKACIQATRILRNPDPQLSIRLYSGIDDELAQLTYDAIGEGCTYPIVYNDEVNIPSVMKAFNLGREEAEQYVPYGCGEYVIDHKSLGTPSGVINLLKGLEVQLFHGTELIHGTRLGLRYKPLEEYDSFEEFYQDYKEHMKYHIEIMAEQEMLEYQIAGEKASMLYMSMLYDDCLEKGEALLDGGIRYLGGTLESYGNINTADSLFAIKKVLFEKKSITPRELLQALKHDFVGYEHIQKMLKDCAKFGNDIDEVDNLAVDLHNFICNTAKKQATRVGLHSYLIVVINNGANTTLGLLTGASADGRNACKPMANAHNPQHGCDTNGVTAMLNSIVKLDTSIHAGAVQNIKFSKETFQQHRSLTLSLIQTYFDHGGPQLMITVVGREDLENAMKFPELYTNLLVRVGGFSARFVELSREMQEEILERTCY